MPDDYSVMRFSQRPENGVKTIRVRLPAPLVEQRRNVLSYARKVCGDIPSSEMEAALFEGSWKECLKPLAPTGSTQLSRTTQEKVTLYNETLWEMEEFINTLMLKGCQGGVRAFYALLPGDY
jgi:hypothetical protein